MIVLAYQPTSYREFKRVIKFAYENAADAIEIRGEKLNEKELKKNIHKKIFQKKKFSPKNFQSPS